MEASRQKTLADTVAEIEVDLRQLADPERAAGAKAYLKSDLEFFGNAIPDLRRQVRDWSKAHSDLDRSGLTRLCRALWKRRSHELRAFAIELLRSRRGLLESGDIALLRWMLERSNSWAYVDAIAVHLVGPMVEEHPGLSKDLDQWSKDGDFWLRRSAILALLLPLRRGSGDWNRFARYADEMLEDKEFFIRKAIGWALRQHSRVDPDAVRDFVEQHQDDLSGLSVREATKYL